MSEQRTIVENLNQILVLKEEIKRKYVIMNGIEKEVIKQLVEGQEKDFPLSDELHATLVWTIEKEIDYDKLRENHPEIYQMGLKTVFSQTQALNSVSRHLLAAVMKDCQKVSMGYKLKIKKKGGME